MSVIAKRVLVYYLRKRMLYSYVCIKCVMKFKNTLYGHMTACCIYKDMFGKIEVLCILVPTYITPIVHA